MKIEKSKAMYMNYFGTKKILNGNMSTVWMRGEDWKDYKIGDILFITEPCIEGKNKGEYLYQTDDLTLETKYFFPITKIPKDAIRIFLKITNIIERKLGDLTKDDYKKLNADEYSFRKLYGNNRWNDDFFIYIIDFETIIKKSYGSS